MGMPVTIALVTVAVGPTYQALLPRWANAVAGLHTEPTEIRVVVDTIESTIARQIMTILPSASILISRRLWRHHPQVLVNDAIANTYSEWVCKIDVDDLIYPHALDNVFTSASDVYCFGISYRGQHLYGQSPTPEQVMCREANLVFSGSPYRRWLWMDNEYKDMIFEDWAFWVGCARKGATFQSSGTIDYEYVDHDQQITKRSNEAYWASIVRGMP